MHFEGEAVKPLNDLTNLLSYILPNETINYFGGGSLRGIFLPNLWAVRSENKTCYLALLLPLFLQGDSGIYCFRTIIQQCFNVFPVTSANI